MLFCLGLGDSALRTKRLEDFLHEAETVGCQVFFIFLLPTSIMFEGMISRGRSCSKGAQQIDSKIRTNLGGTPFKFDSRRSQSVSHYDESHDNDNTLPSAKRLWRNERDNGFMDSDGEDCCDH